MNYPRYNDCSYGNCMNNNCSDCMSSCGSGNSCGATRSKEYLLSKQNLINSCGSCNYMNDLQYTNNMYSMSWPTNPRLANAYVPFQNMNQTYCPREGLRNGTIFPELLD